MPFSAFDFIISGGILAGFIGAVVWLLIASKRVEDRERERSARWFREYFHEGGLVRSLMTRWKPQGRLTDKSDHAAIELPESVDRAELPPVPWRSG